MQVTSIVLADGKTTPANHTFQAVRQTAGNLQYAEPSADGRVSSRNGLYLQQVQAGNGRKTVKHSGRIQIPIFGADGLFLENIQAEFTIVHGMESSKDARRDARVMLSNLLKDSTISGMVDDVVFPM